MTIATVLRVLLFLADKIIVKQTQRIDLDQVQGFVQTIFNKQQFDDALALAMQEKSEVYHLAYLYSIPTPEVRCQRTKEAVSNYLIQQIGSLLDGSNKKVLAQGSRDENNFSFYTLIQEENGREYAQLKLPVTSDNSNSPDNSEKIDLISEYISVLRTMMNEDSPRRNSNIQKIINQFVESAPNNPEIPTPQDEDQQSQQQQSQSNSSNLTPQFRRLRNQHDLNETPQVRNQRSRRFHPETPQGG